MAGSWLLRHRGNSSQSSSTLHFLASTHCQPNDFLLPQLGVHQRVVVQYERLQVNQASHLRWQAVQLVVAQVQIEQVCQVDEQLVGDGVDAIVAQIQHQHVPAVLQVPGDLRQLIVAQVLNREDGESVGRQEHVIFGVKTVCKPELFCGE